MTMAAITLNEDGSFTAPSLTGAINNANTGKNVSLTVDGIQQVGCDAALVSENTDRYRHHLQQHHLRNGRMQGAHQVDLYQPSVITLLAKGSED
jgi:hypothetical protein